MSTVDDRDFERYLRGDDALSRAYSELRSERPSPALDQAVLAQARDALKSARPARAARRRNWPVLTALAATVLLSFGLVMRLALEPESQLPTAAPTQDAVSTLPDESEPAADSQEAASVEPSSPRASPSADTALPASSIEEQRPQIESEIRAAAEQAPVVPEPVPPAAVAPAYAPPPAPAETRARSDAPAARPLRQERASEAATAERDLMRAKKAEAAADTDAGATSANSVAPARELAKENFTKTPEEWLAEIARLRLAGEHDAAERELERFSKAHPGYLDKPDPVDPAPERQ